jgi:hypothetical protein
VMPGCNFIADLIGRFVPPEPMVVVDSLAADSTNLLDVNGPWPNGRHDLIVSAVGWRSIGFSAQWRLGRGESMCARLYGRLDYHDSDCWMDISCMAALTHYSSVSLGEFRGFGILAIEVPEHWFYEMKLVLVKQFGRKGSVNRIVVKCDRDRR